MSLRIHIKQLRECPPNTKIHSLYLNFIRFISDIGASSIKPLFIAGCCITTISLDFSLASERWLFFQNECEQKQSRGDRISGMLSVGCAIVGSFGLILLSILDVVHYRHVHVSLLIVAL
jgi:hypothetical protein